MIPEKDKQFWRAVLFAFVLVLAIAALDVASKNSGIFGSPLQYEQGNYSQGWWGLFKGIALFGFLFLGLMYFFLIRKDFSESLAIALVPYLCFLFGVSDLFYFFIQGRTIPSVLPWLLNNNVIAFFAIGGAVTSASLYISAIVGIGLSLGLAYILRKYF